MQYAPTYTDQKFDSHLLDESQTRRVLGCMSLRPTPPQRETLKICMDARKTRRELDENGHIYRKPGEDWMKMAISIENPAGIGFNMNTAIESLPGIGFHTFPGITFWARMGFV